MTHRVKKDFSELYDKSDIFFVSRVEETQNKEKPEQLVVHPSRNGTIVTAQDKKGKLIETIHLAHYQENIHEMMVAQSALINEEYTQLGFVSNPPIKYVLQPIVLYDGDSPSEMINVVISLYDDGFLIIDFDFLFKNVPFSDLQNFEMPEDIEHYMKRKCLIPNIVLCKNSIEPNIYNRDKVTVSKSIDYYLKYIHELFADSIEMRSNDTYKNYSLISYDGEPENFNSVSNELRADLYWIVNMPRSINEQSKAVYDKFISNYYEINKNAALYLSTVERSVIVMTRERFKINKEDLSVKSHMFTLKSYIDPIVRICLIKKMYYHDMWNFKTPNNDGDLREKETIIYKKFTIWASIDFPDK